MELEAQQLSLFDYASLDTDTRLFVQEKAQAIHTRLKRTAEDIVAIGQDLIAVNEKLAPHGKFHGWLRAEFDMTRQTAYRFMSVAKKFGSCNIMLQLSPTVLYSLLDTPDTVIQMVESGQIPATLSAIRDAKRELHQPVITPTLTEHDAALSGYRGYSRWEEAHEWETKRQEAEQRIPPALVEELLVEKWQPPTSEQLEAKAQYLERWQRDNLALGLDRWGDPLPTDVEQGYIGDEEVEAILAGARL